VDSPEARDWLPTALRLATHALFCWTIAHLSDHSALGIYAELDKFYLCYVCSPSIFVSLSLGRRVSQGIAHICEPKQHRTARGKKRMSGFCRGPYEGGVWGGGLGGEIRLQPRKITATVVGTNLRLTGTAGLGLVA